MSTEKELRQAVAAMVQANTGITTLNYKPKISQPADFASIGVDPAVGYAYVHIPSGQSAMHDLRLCVEVHFLKKGVLNGSGYDQTAEPAEDIGKLITEQQNQLGSFSDPASFSGSRELVEIAGFDLWDAKITFTVVYSGQT
jgi:hypothetical protein